MKKIVYYLQRIKNLGIRESYGRLITRAHRFYFYYTWKPKACAGTAATSWEALRKQHQLGDISATFKTLCKNTIVESIRLDDLFKNNLPRDYNDKELIIKRAQQAIEYSFTLFGSTITFQNKKIDWHTDFKKPDRPWPLVFYQDIVIKQIQSTSTDEYHPDIKVPWELSRMHHLIDLGYAYELTFDTDSKSAQKYSDTFVAQTMDWIQNNPYLMGVNWVCPMDVAIRAVNLIWAFNFFKKDTKISLSFWELLITSLYDHGRYLESNWETSSKPNNHYIADLIGYLYLTSFFNQLSPAILNNPGLNECVMELEKQWNLQVMPDGTSYEGSTSYHRLITEFYLHYYLIIKNSGLLLEPKVGKRLNAMISFLQSCTINNSSLIQVGDNDNGRLITGLEAKSLSPQNKTQINNYNNFGLTVIDDGHWKISSRHTTYSQQQPSGHFHEDELSCTLSIDGQEILIDPGTFLYTSNSYGRNILRSETMHNGPYITTNKKRMRAYELNKLDLFQLPRQADINKSLTTQTPHTIALQSSRHINKSLSLTRELISTNNKLVINDYAMEEVIPDQYDIHWNFIFNPEIEIVHNQQPEPHWICTTKKIILQLRSDIEFKKKEYFFSPSYGIKKVCWGLTSSVKLQTGKKYSVTMTQKPR